MKKRKQYIDDQVKNFLTQQKISSTPKVYKENNKKILLVGMSIIAICLLALGLFR